MVNSNDLEKKVDKKKIVVIDDELVTRKIVERALEKTFDVYIVTNIFESIRVCEIQMPDLILLDLLMPSVDGFEILQLLKHHATLCDTPVICMSSTEVKEDRERVRAQGAIGFIKKPITIKTLSFDINQILDSVTNIISSKKNKVDFITSFNLAEKDKYINSIISNIPKGEKVIFLSWTRGDYFYEENESVRNLIDDESLVFLEIKPTLITKFSYMQELIPLLDDLIGLSGQEHRESHLVFDEPRNLLNIQNTDKSISQAYKISQIFHNTFKQITYINSRPKEDSEQLFLNKIGKILVGNRK
ncbi:response regulator [Halobacteriovorax sp. JY17]|uniref:response regulator n=1 Tax=Halobacteriovorax sp. JY17 TaxID=2014617 RepID=UPI0025B8EEB0|nr:response regulator [Halobacteriovorax sp. JY17]